MEQRSAGILLWRRAPLGLEVYLGHPGGPYWTGKDEGAWTIPKGVVEPGEDALATAIREFEEETGVRLQGPFLDLGSIKQRSGKVVQGFACEGDAPSGSPPSNLIQIKWQGRTMSVPEIDRCEWFEPEVAVHKLNPAQGEFIARLAGALRLNPD